MTRRSGARRALAAAAGAALAASAAAFSTPLGGSQSEVTQFNSLGAGAMKLGPFLTEIDPDVRRGARELAQSAYDGPTPAASLAPPLPRAGPLPPGRAAAPRV